MDSVIETEGLTKQWGTLTAVDNINLRITAGECYAFLGVLGGGRLRIDPKGGVTGRKGIALGGASAFGIGGYVLYTLSNTNMTGSLKRSPGSRPGAGMSTTRCRSSESLSWPLAACSDSRTASSYVSVIERKDLGLLGNELFLGDNAGITQARQPPGLSQMIRCGGGLAIPVPLLAISLAIPTGTELHEVPLRMIMSGMRLSPAL